MRRRQVTLHYCNACRSTTRHAETDTTSSCLKCGTVKHITRIVKTSPAHNHHRGDEADWA